MVEGMIPWAAEATVVKMPLHAGGDPELVFEGTLADAVAYLRQPNRAEIIRYRVSLPNRHEQPRSYQGLTLLELLGSVPPWTPSRQR